MRRTIIASCLLPLVLAGCGERPAPATGQDPQPASALGRVVGSAIEKARKELATSNISLDGTAGLPKAEITPQGDLLVDGRKVETTAGQRALLLAHRANIVAIAEFGMAIGVQGADIGMMAASEALKGIVGGDMDRRERRIEAEAAKIEASARELCTRLPAMLASQDALAAALPEFSPYATMDQRDIDDCRADSDAHMDDRQRAQLRDEIRSDIRSGIRRSIQAAVQGAGLADRGTRDAQEEPADEEDPPATR